MAAEPILNNAPIIQRVSTTPHAWPDESFATFRRPSAARNIPKKRSRSNWLNTATNTVLKTINVGLTPFAVAVRPDGARLFVLNRASGNVSVVDTATTALEWAADHATQLDADPDAVLVGGIGEGADLAARVAAGARVNGWPELVGEVLLQER